MKLYIDQDSNTFITDTLFKAPVNSVSFKRGDAAQVELIFVSANTALSATNDKQITFGIKEAGKYDGDYVVSASSYTTSGTSYILNPNFNTTTLNQLLCSGDANDSNDIASVSTMLEVTWSTDAGTSWYSTNTITATIANDVNKGGEASPVANQTLIEWLEINHPPALVLSAAPVDETYASVTIDPTGADNSVLYTSLTANTFGNSTTIEYLSAISAATTTVSVTGQDIVVQAGTTARMGISGVTLDFYGVAVSDAEALYGGVSDGKPFYGLLDPGISWSDAGNRWELYFNGDNVLSFYANEDVATPDLVVTWFPDGSAAGTPVITPATSSAQQVIDAVNNDASASALVLATAVGTVSGSVATVAQTSLSGGVGTVGVLDQNAIVNEADVYKCVRTTPTKWVQLN